MTYLLVLEMDLSLTTGYSINERESAVALMDRYGDRITVMAPEPKFPEVFRDDRIVYVRDHARHHPVKYLLHLISCWRAVRKLLKSGKVRAIITRPGLVAIVPLMLTWRGVPVILKTTALARFQRKDLTWKHAASGLLADPILKSLLRRSVGIDTMTRVYVELAEKTLGVGEGKMEVVANGVNQHMFKPYDKAAARKKFKLDGFRALVGYVGALHPHRRLDRVISSLLALADLPDTALVLVGKGPQRQELEEKAKELGVADRVIFYGFVPYTDVPELTSCFDVSVDLTLHTIKVGEVTHTTSYSQKMAQFLSCGVPVIAWDTKETRYLADNDVGRLATYDDVEELTAALRHFLEPDCDHEAYVAKCRDYACAHLSYDVLADQRLAFWDRLTTKPSGTAR